MSRCMQRAANYSLIKNLHSLLGVLKLARSMDVCNYRLSAASAAITAGHQLKNKSGLQMD